MQSAQDHPGFYERSGPHALSEVARVGGAVAAPGSNPALPIRNVVPLDLAEVGDVAFLDNRKYLAQFANTRATACFVLPDMAERVPVNVVPLVTKAPYHAFARALAFFYPGAGMPITTGVLAGEPSIHPTASIGDGAVIEHGAVIGREAQHRRPHPHCGRRRHRRPHLDRGGRVRWPVRQCRPCPPGQPGHPASGVRIGQDGFGFAMGPKGHLKVPQIGRVIIQDDVEIGANSCVDRGALKDTVIGEGTKIDNLVQIGHNVVIGRHCVIVGQVGIAGSAELGDFVVMGGQAGLVGHIKVGSGAQIAGGSHAKDDVPAGARMGGTPAHAVHGMGAPAGAPSSA